MPKPIKQMIAMAAPIEIEAAASDDSASPAKFTSLFYTGGALQVAGWEHPVVVDLSGLKVGNSLVANLDHDPTKRVGNFSVINDGKSLVASGVASAATPARDEVVQSAKAGFQWQASLEVKPHRVEMLKAGKATQVNGQQVVGPAIITRDGTLKGLGFVSHGADDNTTVTIAAGAASDKEFQMRAEVKEWIKGRFPSVDIDAMSADEVANWEADFDGVEGKRKPPVNAGSTATDTISREILEARRRESFEQLTANFLSGMPLETKTLDFLSAIGDLKTKAIEGQWSPDKFDTELLRMSIPMARAPIASGRDRGHRMSNEVLTAAICQAGGLRDLDAHFSDQVLQTAKDQFREGIGLKQLLCIAAEDKGYRCSGFNVNLDVQRAAFGQLPQIHASQFSTLSIPGILSDSANKFLLEGWGGGEMAWESITDVITVRDFKTITQYKLSGRLKYEKVGKAGEIKHGTVTEDSYTNKADTYGKMFALTREDIINDDLNALAQVPRELGYGANDAFNEVFWTEFLGGDGSFFASGNSNVSTGTVTASTVLATLAAAEVIFFAQTKPNGEPLGILPNVILAPNGAYRVFLNAMASTQVTGGSSTVPTANSFAGDYQVVRSAYLSNSAYTGYSTAKWYLLAVRPGFAAIQTAFLNGQRNPVVETASADFNTLGIQMRGVHDFGVNLFEYRAGVQGSGA